MGSYVERYWVSDASGMNKTERLGGAYYPYVPDTISDFELLMEPACATAVARAQEVLNVLEGSGSLTDTEPLARLLLRAEAVSSSRIEGLELPAGKLLEYEELDRLGVEHRLDSTEAQVLGNLHALVGGLEKVQAGYEFAVDGICELNRTLLEGTRLSDVGGMIRETQNWIGGNRVNPVGAAYVPPEPKLVPGLMEDLVAFLNETELPAVAAAAIAHAQLETIHPFSDGNGRTGRALAHMILKTRGLARATVPPVSLVLATDRDRYIANLSAYRTDGTEGRNEVVNGWVEYFANATLLSCERAIGFERTIADIKDGWIGRTGFRAGSAGRLLLDVLPGTPAISIKTAQALTKRSYPAARSAVLALVDAGILHQNSKNRKSGIYVAREVIDAFNAYERALATVSGDTTAEKPRRHVPQRMRKS
ncbi:MAG: Fic family protein [Eggerthellaceae bacterium]|nr:Fic family protein [Eggerthellaceae bacterium]